MHDSLPKAQDRVKSAEGTKQLRLLSFKTRRQRLGAFDWTAQIDGDHLCGGFAEANLARGYLAELPADDPPVYYPDARTD